MLTDVPDDAELLQEEIFGPVAPISGFDDEDEAIAAANNTEYGLVAYVFTSDLKRALRVCERLETGMIGLNQGMVSNARRRSAASSSRASAARAALRGSRSTSRPSTSPSTCSGSSGAPLTRTPHRYRQRGPRRSRPSFVKSQLGRS